MTPQAQATKEKTGKLDIIKINFCASKGIKKLKKYTKGEKIFANHVFHNGLVSKIYKELLQLKNRRQPN